MRRYAYKDTYCNRYRRRPSVSFRERWKLGDLFQQCLYASVHAPQEAGNMSPAKAQAWATHLQRLLALHSCLHPHQIITERNRCIDSHIENRIRKLSALPSTMGEGGLEVPFGDENSNSEDKKENQLPQTLGSLSTSRSRMLAHASGKLRAIIELKALRVREKQCALRAQVVECLAHGSLLPLASRQKGLPQAASLHTAGRADDRATQKEAAHRTREEGQGEAP